MPEDAPRIQELADDRRIADVTASIPHPYPEGAAAAWIAGHGPAWERRENATFTIQQKSADTLMGAISIMRIGGGRAELGYWLGVPYWGQGYATEAVRGLYAFAAESLGLERLEARVLARNPASSGVLRKAGFVLTGRIVEACGQHSDPEPLDLFELELKRTLSNASH